MPKRIKPLQIVGRSLPLICTQCAADLKPPFRMNRKFCSPQCKEKYQRAFGSKRWEVRGERDKELKQTKKMVKEVKKRKPEVPPIASTPVAHSKPDSRQEILDQRMKMHPRLLALYGNKKASD